MSDPVTRSEDRNKGRHSQTYVFKLYVAGTTKRAVETVQEIKRICEKHLNGRYTLHVIDIYQQPQLARSNQIVAVPALIKAWPKPVRVATGCLTDEEQLLVKLDLVQPKDRRAHDPKKAKPGSA